LQLRIFQGQRDATVVNSQLTLHILDKRKKWMKNTVTDNNTGMRYLGILERVMLAGEGGQNGLGFDIKLTDSPSRA
jgi:hypothetical protein